LWRGPHTGDARRKNRRDETFTQTTDLRRCREKVQRRSGMVRRLAASDGAARPANAEGNQKPQERRPDRTDRCSATGKGTPIGEPIRPGQDGCPRAEPAATRPARTHEDVRRIDGLHAEAERTNTRTGRAKDNRIESHPTAGDERTKRAGLPKANKGGHVDRNGKGIGSRTARA